MIKSVKVFPFSFWKIITKNFFTSFSNPWHKHAKWPPSDLTPWTLTLDKSVGGPAIQLHAWSYFVSCLSKKMYDILFFSLDWPVSKNQILHKKCEPNFLLSFQFEKRRGQAVLFSFEYNLFPNLISNIKPLHALHRLLI